MEAAVGGTPFAAVLYDGKQEISIGSYVVWPSFNVKKFRSVISERIGVSESQVSIYLADRRGSRLPLSHRINIPAVCLEHPGAWFFLVVLKRSSPRRPKVGRPPPVQERYLARSGAGNQNCEECSKGTGEFHSCVNDAVVKRFRSWAGPVARPDKRPVFPYPEYRLFPQYR